MLVYLHTVLSRFRNTLRRFGPLVALVLLGGGVAVASDDHETARRLSEAGEILPLEAVLAHAQDRQPGRVLDVELETDHGRHIYEIEILDTHGVVWELSFDAHSGALLEREREH